MPQIEALLDGIPGFAELSRPLLARCARQAELIDVQEGRVLFREGTVPEAIYVLLEGQIALTGDSPEPAGTVIDVLRPGSSFVLANALTEQPYQTGAQVVTFSRLLRIPAQTLRAGVAEDPAAALAMLRAVSQELAGMTRQVIDLKRHVTAERLSAYLLSHVPDPRARTAEFRLPFNKGLLAAWLGCRAENLSRAFAALRRFGVETHGSRVVLHDVSQLRAYAGNCGVMVLDAPVTVAPSSPKPLFPVEEVFGDAFRLRAGGAARE